MTIAKADSSSETAKRNRVILEFLPLVKAIAVRARKSLPAHVDLDDLVHAGVLGLIDAAAKFNPGRGVSFPTYAKHRIRGEMLDSLRKLDWASRDLRRRSKQMEAATAALSSDLQRTPAETEVASKLGVELVRLRAWTVDLRTVGLVSGSTRPGGPDLPEPDFPDKLEHQPDSICLRVEMRAALGTAMKALPERYRRVVALYYTDEMTMREIGDVLGVNESWVSQIHKSALQKMASTLQSSGIQSSRAF